MQAFALSDRMSKIYDNANGLKSETKRIMSTLDFNERVLSLALDKDTPILEKINFIKIVFSNLDEFISIKIADIQNDSTVKKVIDRIESLYFIMNDLLNELKDNYDLSFQYQKDINENHSTIVDSGIYFVYLDSTFNFHISVFSGSLKDTIDALKKNHIKVAYSFMVRFISDKAFEYTYAGEDDRTVLQEIKALLIAKENMSVRFIQTTCGSDEIMNAFTDFLGINDAIYFHTGDFIMQIQNMKVIKEQETENDSFQKLVPAYTKLNYMTELQQHDIFMRTPYSSYDHVLDFIDQMCTSNEITTIFMTLYRVKAQSKIVNSLIKAKKLGKRVFVYVEVTARGNEELNADIIQTLLKNHIEVMCTCHGVKVHAKLFCAINKNGLVYTHVSTGNYNESNAKVYTDFQFFTANTEITKPILITFIELFNDNIIQLDQAQSRFFKISPIGLRNTFLEKINQEMRKRSEGRILIKCNSLCDPQIISKLYQASDYGVQIKIICRTGCSIVPNENIEIASKVGRYLEHDRFYIFGNDAYISSADMLTRNLDKRIETLCKIINSDFIQMMINEFFKIWDDPKIFHLSEDSKTWYKDEAYLER
jgi:polyphosphate kinase